MLDRLFKKFGFDRYISAKTFSNLSALVTSTVIAAALPIVFAPVMSRIFSPADYGMMGIFAAISGLIGVLANANYIQAILIPAGHKEASDVYWFSLFFCGIISAASALVIAFLFFLTPVFNNSDLQGWALLIPVSIFFSGANVIMLTWVNRVQQYAAIALNRIWQVLLTISLQISLGLWLKNETGLMVGFIAGQVLSVLLLVRAFKKMKELHMAPPDTRVFKQVAIRYRKFLIYTTPSEFINILVNQLPLFLIQRYGGIAYAGAYNFTQRILGVPQQFLSSAVVEVFRQKASAQIAETGQCAALYVKTAKVLFTLAVLPFTVIAFFAKPLFTFFFGAEWAEAGVFAQYLSLLFFFRFLGNPLSYLYILRQRLKEDLICHLYFLVSSFAIFFWLMQHSIYTTLFVYAINYSLIYLYVILRAYQFSKPPA
jgi:O-antigen/teichoic acid export membrane protein